jgi:hypothetical protein
MARQPATVGSNEASMTTGASFSILVIDVGKPENLGWANSNDESGGSETLAGAVDWLAATLREGGQAALGIEAPLWTPRRSDVRKITSARIGEGSRSWTAAPGACVTTAGLGGMGFVFGRLAGCRATVRPDRWLRNGGLLIWEAFISGGGRGKGHSADARIALDAFALRWPDFFSDLKPEPAVNLAVAAALASGVLINADEIGEPALVVRAFKGAGDALP